MNAEHPCLSPWKGAVIGGLIAFVWSNITWMALPFHEKTITHLEDPAPLVAAMQNADSGVYIMRNDPSGQTAPTDPFIFVSYYKRGWGPLRTPMILSFLTLCVGAFFWTWILGKIPGLTSRDAALYGAFFGLAVAALGVLPNWVWWKFPLGFTLLYAVDLVVTWALASVAIARFGRAAVCPLPAAKS